MNQKTSTKMTEAMKKVSEAEDLIRRCFEQVPVQVADEIYLEGEAIPLSKHSHTHALRKTVSPTFARATLREAARSIRKAAQELTECATELLELPAVTPPAQPALLPEPATASAS